MANQKTSSKALKSVLGATLLAIGFALFFANLDAVQASVSRILGRPASTGIEGLPALILATTHAVQAYAFDHQGFLSVLQQILVSFWPLILVMTGAGLLRNAFVSSRPQFQAEASVDHMGNR